MWTQLGTWINRLSILSLPPLRTGWKAVSELQFTSQGEEGVE